MTFLNSRYIRGLLKFALDCTLPISGKNFSLTGNPGNGFDLFGNDLGATNCSANETADQEKEALNSLQVKFKGLIDFKLILFQP